MSLVGVYLCFMPSGVGALDGFSIQIQSDSARPSDNVYFNALGVIDLHLMIWIERARR